jgi:hypothetical protein
MTTLGPTVDNFQRKIAFTAGCGLLLMALLAPFANFVVLQKLVVPDATVTANNIMASEGLFRSGIAAFLVVIILDIVVAWALYVLLRRVNETIALLAAWLRLAFAAVFAYALVNLLDAVQMLGDTESSTLQPEQLHAQARASIASFDNGWQIGLAIFGFHLLGLGFLLIHSADFPRFLGVLVMVSGGGYLADSFGTILIPDYQLTVAVFTFIGEALLIPWLFWKSMRGFRPDPGSHRGQAAGPLTEQRRAFGEGS